MTRMSFARTYLITGASRGIGLGVTTELLARPSTTVIAAVRNPSQARKVLDFLPKVSGNKLIVVKLDSTIDSDAAAAIATLQKDHGITLLDVVLANAGMYNSVKHTFDMTTADAVPVFVTNTMAPIVLAGAARDLLRAADKPVFAITSSIAGSLSFLEPMLNAVPMSPYGASKAAANWLVRRLHFEEDWLTSVALHPGTVITDMAKSVDLGDFSIEDLGPITVEESAKGIVGILEGVDKEKFGGRLVDYKGDIIPW